ncbi:MAG: apolipoprotein N-acyltransferase, partial [Pseudomonadota bacterium]
MSGNSGGTSDLGPLVSFGPQGRFVLFFRALTGWRRWALSVCLGAFAVLAFEPLGFTPALLISFTGLLWLLDGVDEAGRGLRQAFLDGWGFGVGFFAAGLHWVGHAFLVDAETFAALMPVAVVLLTAGLALFTGAASAFYVFIAVPGPGRVFLFAGVWLIFEWLRGHILSGFPWNLMGYVWADYLWVAQGASLVGVYGLSLLTVALAASPAAIFTPFPSAKGRRFAWAPAGFLATVFILIAAFGALRLGTSLGEVAEVRLRIVQANIPQADKYERVNRIPIMEKYLALTGRPAEGEPPTHIIWPEAAPPFLLSRGLDFVAAMGATLAPQQVLITGAPRVTVDETTGESRYFNSLFAGDRAAWAAFGATGEPEGLSLYDKSHLVPFGEYLPLQPIL